LLRLLSAPGFAQQLTTEAQLSAIRKSCRADIEALCPDVSGGGQAAPGCLQSHAASVSGRARPERPSSAHLRISSLQVVYQKNYSGIT
jgi:hypothetical protein